MFAANCVIATLRYFETIYNFVKSSLIEIEHQRKLGAEIDALERDVSEKFESTE